MTDRPEVKDPTDLQLPSGGNVPTEVQDTFEWTYDRLFALRKSKAQKQCEYRRRIAASRTPEQLVAARKSAAERQRRCRLRKANSTLVSASPELTNASSDSRRPLTHEQGLTSAESAQKPEKKGIAPLEKFKRRLVRDIARRRYQEKQPEDEMFKQLDTEYGCECKLLWEHMTSLTRKKLKRLLEADDRANCIRIARMTTTDWLTFDLALVHEKLDVIGQDMIGTGKADRTIHSLLFDLVKKHNIEEKAEQNADPKILVEAWFTLTQEYNTGGRECSPMLLQRRWYQLKETTRSKLYDFWMNYRGNPRLYAKALSRKPTPLQMSIAETYPEIITDTFEKWEDLIKKKKVMLASDFEIQTDKGKSNRDGEPDLIVIEPNIETIEVVANSDNEEYNNDETDNSDTNSALVEEEYTIKDEPIDSIDSEESEPIDIPLENVISNFKQSEKVSETAPVENDILLPKITCVMGNVLLPECNMEKNVGYIFAENIQKRAENSRENTCHDDDDDVQIISDPIKNKYNPIDYDPVGNGSIPIDCYRVGKDSIPKDADELSSKDNIKETTEVGDDDSKLFNIDGIIPEFPVDLHLIDDGIELIDHTDYDQDITLYTKNKEDDSENTDENNTACRVDPKLILFPITYTKKIDEMDVFKNSSFLTVKGNDIIQRALVESKPIFEKSAEEEHFSEEDCDDASNPISRLKFTNWRLQKPKNRSYNPIKLCKNPDFNTRLKKLTVGFFSSERNRLLFSACKPLTIDLHKGFEDSLVDNTLYLERIDSPIVKKEKDIEVCKNTATVIPSTMSMLSLLDNRMLKVQEFLKTKEENLENGTPEQYEPKQETIEEQIPTNTVVVKRKKIVNLPNIEQMRQQNLLVAEVSPMPLQYIAQDSTPPVQLVSPAKSTSRHTVSIKSDATTSKSNTVREPKICSRPVNIVYKNHEKPFVKRKTNSVPKLKPTQSVPAWSQPSTYRPKSEGSLTCDTLHKMLCLLSGKVPSKYKKKKQKGNEKELANEGKNKAIPKNPTSTAKVDALVKNDKIDLTKDLLRIGIKRRKKRLNTVSSKSGYCCWAQYRLNYLSTDPKLRHLCPKLRHLCSKPFCKCCCRNHLFDRMVYEQSLKEVGKVVKIDNFLVQNNYPADDQNVTPDSVSSNNGTLQQFDSQNNFESLEITPSSTVIKTATVDEINESFIHSINYHLPKDTPLKAVTLQSETSVQEDKQAADAISRTDAESPNQGYQGISIIRTRLMSGSWVTKRMDSIEEAKKSVPLESEQRQSDTVNSQHNNTEPAIVINDDQTPRELENKLTTAEQILPKGVSIVLLPDKRVSIAIDPNAQVDPEELAQVPEILLSVQKYFAEAGIINPSQNITKNEVISNNNLNILEMIAANESVDQETVSNVVPNSDITDVAFNITDPQSQNVGNDNVNDLSADDSQQMNSYPLILKSNEQVESTHSYFNENVILGETQNHPPNSQDNTDMRSDETKRTTNRTTILSDLMAMSGISQEDSSVPLENPIPSVSLIPSTSSNILNYSLVKAADLKNAKVVRKGGQIKKVVVSLKKKSELDIPLLSNAVIDLTDDCNDSDNVEKSDNQDADKQLNDTAKNTFRNTDNVEPPVGKFHALNKEGFIPYSGISKLRKIRILKKHSGPVSPFKIMRSNDVRSYNFDKEVSLMRSYKIFEEKSKQNSLLHKFSISSDKDSSSEEYWQNDSSDDEPITKKVKRIRGNTMQSEQSDNESGGKVDSILPIETYNIPEEFAVQPEMKNIIVNNNTEVGPKTS